MRIAYISFEHPAGVAGGGIGTYVGQIARIMCERGHDVEVFAGHKTAVDTIRHQGYPVHRIGGTTMQSFREEALPVFATRHSVAPFDVIEAAEYGADALRIKENYPKLPLVVKLHTPSFLTGRLNSDGVRATDKLRFFAGGLLRGKLHKAYWVYRKEDDLEYTQYRLATAVCSPSASLVGVVEETWGRHQHPVQVIPNPFQPPAELLAIPIHRSSRVGVTVSFVGRLEKRKGVLELMKAIPLVLAKHPHTLFQFIGQSHPSPNKGVVMEEFIQADLPTAKNNLRFLGPRPYAELPGLLAATDICVFPSLWENFPNVCLEAMAAGRAVVASSAGGMAEMITDGEQGLLVPPANPSAIANAVIRLIESPGLSARFGNAARQRVQEAYGAPVIGAVAEAFYEGQLQPHTVQAFG